MTWGFPQRAGANLCTAPPALAPAEEAAAEPTPAQRCVNLPRHISCPAPSSCFEAQDFVWLGTFTECAWERCSPPSLQPGSRAFLKHWTTKHVRALCPSAKGGEKTAGTGALPLVLPAPLFPETSASSSREGTQPCANSALSS